MTHSPLKPVVNNPTHARQSEYAETASKILAKFDNDIRLLMPRKLDYSPEKKPHETVTPVKTRGVFLEEVMDHQPLHGSNFTESIGKNCFGTFSTNELDSYKPTETIHLQPMSCNSKSYSTKQAETSISRQQYIYIEQPYDKSPMKYTFRDRQEDTNHQCPPIRHREESPPPREEENPKSREASRFFQSTPQRANREDTSYEGEDKEISIDKRILEYQREEECPRGLPDLDTSSRNESKESLREEYITMDHLNVTSEHRASHERGEGERKLHAVQLHTYFTSGETAVFKTEDMTHLQDAESDSPLTEKIEMGFTSLGKIEERKRPEIVSGTRTVGKRSEEMTRLPTIEESKASRESANITESESVRNQSRISIATFEKDYQKQEVEDRKEDHLSNSALMDMITNMQAKIQELNTLSTSHQNTNHNSAVPYLATLNQSRANMEVETRLRDESYRLDISQEIERVREKINLIMNEPLAPPRQPPSESPKKGKQSTNQKLISIWEYENADGGANSFCNYQLNYSRGDSIGLKNNIEGISILPDEHSKNHCLDESQMSVGITLLEQMSQGCLIKPKQKGSERKNQNQGILQ